MSKRMEEERQDPVARPSQGNTVSAQGEDQAPKARTPNEHDESADHQASETASARRMGALAHGDVTEGKQDTSKSQEMDATYHRVQQASEPAPVLKPQRKP